MIHSICYNIFKLLRDGQINKKERCVLIGTIATIVPHFLHTWYGRSYDVKWKFVTKSGLIMGG